MNVSELTLKLVIILIPGIIATLIYEKLTERREERNSFRLTILAVVFGFLSYSFVQMCCLVYCFIRNACSNGAVVYFGYLHTFRNISDTNDIPYKEVLAASCIAVVFAYLVAGLRKYHVLNVLGRKLKLTSKASDNDVFIDFLHGDVEWIYVRDLSKRLTYKGYLKRFHERDDSRELLLRSVTVYNYDDSVELYKVSEAYLCFKTDNFIIEKATLNS